MKILKQLICVFLILQLMFVAVNAEIFIDTRNHWGKSYIENLAHRNIVNGVDDNSFEPDRYVTREELIKLIYLIAEPPIISYFGQHLNDRATYEQIFEDVDPEGWSGNYIYLATVWAYIFVEEFPDNKFMPTQYATRDELALWVFRLLHHIEEKSSALRFDDNSKIVNKGAVGALADIGLIHGFEDNTFRPSEPVTRSQAAKIICLADELYLKNKLDTYENWKEFTSIEADLNNDGNNELIKRYAESIREDENGIHSYGPVWLQINGKNAYAISDKVYEKIQIVDLDESDAFNEIALTKETDYGFLYTQFYRYTGNDFYYMGEVIGHLETNLLLDGNNSVISESNGNEQIVYKVNNRGFIEITNK